GAGNRNRNEFLQFRVRSAARLTQQQGHRLRRLAPEHAGRWSCLSEGLPQAVRTWLRTGLTKGLPQGLSERLSERLADLRRARTSQQRGILSGAAQQKLCESLDRKSWQITWCHVDHLRFP